MDQTWRTVTNPGAGETFTFLETAQERGGLRVVTLLALDPGGGVSPHSHRQHELFECIDGEVAVHLEGNERTLSEGETLVANPHTMHGLRNHGDSRATLRATVTPAGDFDRLMRTLADLARDGRMVPGRPPRVNPLVMAYLA